MPRYFFHINNGNPYRDDVGEELRDVGEAWLAAKRLTRDIEDTLEPNTCWQVEVTDTQGRALYLIEITGRKVE